jgi:rare lipoprotein A
MSAPAARARRWLALLLLVGACGGTAARPRGPAVPAEEQRGLATWYGGRHHGGPTASGERFDQEKLTAAHRTLPFGTLVRVTNLKNDREVTVRINDRGPYGEGRIIDLSRAAARLLDMLGDGVVPVAVRVLATPGR